MLAPELVLGNQVHTRQTHFPELNTSWVSVPSQFTFVSIFIKSILVWNPLSISRTLYLYRLEGNTMHEKLKLLVVKNRELSWTHVRSERTW